MRKILAVLALVLLPQILLAQGKFSGFKGHSIFKIVSADSAETSYGVLFRDDVQFLANFIANLSSGEVTRFIAPGGDTLIIGPAGFLGTNSYAAGPRAFQYKDLILNLIAIDTTGMMSIGPAPLPLTADLTIYKTTETALLRLEGANGSSGSAQSAEFMLLADTDEKFVSVRFYDSDASGTPIGGMLLDRSTPTISGTEQNDIVLFTQSGSGKKLHLATEGTSRVTVNSIGNFGLATTIPDRLFHPEVSDAVTNAVTYGMRLSHITSGLVAPSFGVGTEYELENARGVNELVATQEYVYTDTTNASEDVDFVIKLMAAGAAAAEKLRVSSTGGIGIGGTITTYDNIATAGEGVLAVRAKPAISTGNTATVSSFASITTPNDGAHHEYMVSGFMSVTAFTSGAIELEVVFTDHNAVAQTKNIPLVPDSGVPAGTATGGGYWMGQAAYISADPNTTITVRTAGTFVATYDIGATILQVD